MPRLTFGFARRTIILTEFVIFFIYLFIYLFIYYTGAKVLRKNGKPSTLLTLNIEKII